VRKTVGNRGRKVLAACLILIAVTAASSGCGGGSDSQSASITNPAAREAGPTPAQARRIGEICAQATRETSALRANLARLMSRGVAPEQAITEGMVAPGIAVLEKESRRLQAMAPEVESEIFATFAGLFEPVLTLAYQRLASGEAQQSGESHELEALTGGLTLEQTRLAASLGLKGCETDFFQALGTTQ
jgi:hypothetical protein